MVGSFELPSFFFNIKSLKNKNMLKNGMRFIDNLVSSLSLNVIKLKQLLFSKDLFIAGYLNID